MSTPILAVCALGAIALLYLAYKLWDRRRRESRRFERKARHVRRRAHQYAWDMVMRRNGPRRLTDQRDRTD